MDKKWERSLLVKMRDEVVEFDSPMVQYTGLKDKNGVEIYEGDILEATMGKDRYGGVMKWEDNRNGWTPFSPIARFEIIGNIYQTPELLEADS